MPEVSLASLNLRFGFTPRTETPFDVTGAVASLDADVVALQEVWSPKSGPRAHEIAAAELGYEFVDLALGRSHNRTAPHPVQLADGMHGTWWGVAILSRLPIIKHESFEFDPIAFDAGQRRALVAHIETPWTSPLAVVTPHLTYRPWGSFNHLRALARNSRALGTDTVVLGDLNMWGPVVSRLVPGWLRPVRGRTWPAHRPHSQIDHILISPELVASGPAVLDDVGSDHLPVRTVVSPRRPPESFER